MNQRKITELAALFNDRFDQWINNNNKRSKHILSRKLKSGSFKVRITFIDDGVRLTADCTHINSDAAVLGALAEALAKDVVFKQLEDENIGLQPLPQKAVVAIRDAFYEREFFETFIHLGFQTLVNAGFRFWP